MAATIKLRAFPTSSVHDCPHCKAPITVYDPDGSQFVVCPGCYSYNRFIGTGYLQMQEMLYPIRETPLLALGAVGTLRDTPYKVLGYLEKKETDAGYEWREYMLYSFTKGYAFLAEYDGHWSFIAGKEHFPQLASAEQYEYTATMDDVEYHMYNRYTPHIIALVGEYDWDVYKERVLTREFISPPFLLVKEQQGSKVVDWYLGEYIEPEEIAQGFNIPIGNFPETVDIGANQPNKYKKRWVYSIKISVFAAILLVAIQVLLCALRPGNLIMDKNVDLTLAPTPIDTTKRDTSGLLKHDSSGVASVVASYMPAPDGNYEYRSLKTSTFNINNGPAPVDIELISPVDNNWFEATIELVNEKDNQTWDVSKTIEYYHGYEGGESWSEGSQVESVTLHDIPEGKYHLNIYPYGGSPTIDHMGIKVQANVILWQNIVISMLLLCLYPLFCWYMYRRFEVNRWMDNEYSPYKKEATDD